MNKSLKNKIPLVFLLFISIWWGYYYQANSALNDFGQANFEWLYLLDGLLVLPILCLLCIKSKKEAFLKAVIYSCLVILIGSYIIPETSKFIWHYLEQGRYLILGLFLLFEITALLTVYLAIRVALNSNQDPDQAIAKPIKNFFGETAIANLLIFEARMWTYAFFAKKIRQESFIGTQHFSYHLKDGAQSNAIGFIILIAAEMPIMHLILHFLWSPLAANIITLLTLFSLAFFTAEYRAMSKRPISIDKNRLYIRFGIYNSKEINLENIESITKSSSLIKRNKSIKRYNFAGNPNIRIQLKQSYNNIDKIYLGLDKPEEFIGVLNSYSSKNTLTR
ncbi:MAG: hypothetical protein HWE16_08440 [Gammaproteobacteria bacterium]|nr:hypothetical protein [Gammaproteobacteria bacterium]